ncbi:MAG: hypothetical protein ACHQVS_00720 [Candidatus Babeliales bacterium]
MKWVNINKRKPSTKQEGSTFVEAINIRFNSMPFVVTYDPFSDIFTSSEYCCSSKKNRALDITHWIPLREYPKAQSTWSNKDNQLHYEVDEE